MHTATAQAILEGRRLRVPAPRPRWSTTGSSTGSAYGLADRLQIPKEEAQEFIDAYLERFPKVKQFIDETIERAREEGHVTTLFGRIRRVPELRLRQFQTRLRRATCREHGDTGHAADIIKVAMVRCRDELRDDGLQTKLVLQIHDEPLFEGPEGEVERASEIVRREMAGAFEMRTPRSRSTWVPARTGSRRSSGHEGCCCAGDRGRGRIRGAPGAGQLDARQDRREPRGGLVVVRRGTHLPRAVTLLVGAGSATSAKRATCPGTTSRRGCSAPPT